MNLRSTAPLTVCPPGIDPIMLALRQTEASAHRAGWGAPVALHILHRLSGTTNQIAVTAATRVPHVPPMRVLTAMLRSIDQIDPATLAYILVAEAVVTYTLQGEVDALGDAAPQHTNIARSAFLATLAGRDIHLVRFRGEEPEEQHECDLHPPDPLLLMLRVCANKAAVSLRAGGV